MKLPDRFDRLRRKLIVWLNADVQRAKRERRWRQRAAGNRALIGCLKSASQSIQGLQQDVHQLHGVIRRRRQHDAEMRQKILQAIDDYVAGGAAELGGIFDRREVEPKKQ